MTHLDHFYQTIGEDWFPYTNLYASMVQHFGNNSKFVEVGCWKGRSASFLAVEINNSNKEIKLDCIDTWKGSLNEDYHQNDDYVKEDKLYELFLKNIEPVKHIINPIRTTSIDGSKLYKDNSLDFVFIDACHTYECVKEDIEHWLPKVKLNGFLCGHDFHYKEVQQAVLEKFDRHQIAFDQIGDCWIYHKK